MTSFSAKEIVRGGARSWVGKLGMVQGESMNDFDVAAANGEIRGKTSFHKHGYLPSMRSNETDRDVWDLNLSGGYPGFIDAAAEVTASSDSSDDSETGPGCQSIRVTGIRADGDPITFEEFPTNGTSSASLGSWYRISRVRARAAGSAGSNVGTITLTAAGGEIMAAMLPGNGRALMAIMSVPRTQRLFIRQIHMALGKSAQGEYGEWSLKAREPGMCWEAHHRDNVLINSASELDFDSGPIVLDPGSDVVVRMHSVTTNNVAVACSWSGTLVDLRGS